MTSNITDRVRQNTSEKTNKQIDEKLIASLQAAKQNPSEIDHKLSKLYREWDIERWLEMNASCIAFIGVLLGFFVHIYWLILPALVLLFLFQHAVQGWCPPLPIFRHFNVRTQKEIDQEIYSLKAIRGDFSNQDFNSPEQIIAAMRK